MNLACLNLKILLLLFIGLFSSHTVLADEFSHVLLSLQAEARAQAHYFSGLIEEYRGMADQNIFKIEEECETIQASANAAQQSRMFWVVFEKSVEILSEQYSRISEFPSVSKKNYESDSIQKSIQFILQQFSRSAIGAFQDLAVNFAFNVKRRRDRLSQLQAVIKKDERKLGAIFDGAFRKIHENPKSNPHLDLNIDEITRLYNRWFKGFEGYRRYFMDFKNLFGVYHYLYPFYKGVDPIESFPLLKLQWVKDRWVDQIAEFDVEYLLVTTADLQKFRKKKQELDYQREDGAYPFEGNFLAPKAAEEQWLREQEVIVRARFSEWVDRDLEAMRKNMKNRKNKERKKRNKATEKQARLAISSAAPKESSESGFLLFESSSILPDYKEQSQFKNDLTVADLDSLKDDAAYLQAESEVSEISSSLEKSTVTVEEEVKDDEYNINYQEYLLLVKNERDRTLEKIQKTRSHASNSSVEDSEPAKINLTAGAARIYQTAMGLDNSKVRNRDLQQFLNQVGGYFVKCSGQHSDLKIALPNFNENATNPFWVDKMHLMHSGAENFPISRLRTHLFRMIIESGLDRFVKVEL